MYKKQFVAAIKVDNKVLRESNERVELPFGSEYAILLKNLDSVRVQARVSIDGNDAVDWVIIGPNSEVTLERFFSKSGSLDKGNRFKFIERSEAVEAHRGIKADDGLVRVEWKREKLAPPQPVTVEHHTYHHHYEWPLYRYNGSIVWNTTQTLASGAFQGQTVNSSRGMSASLHRGGITGQSVSASAEPMATADIAEAIVGTPFNYTFNEVGITAPGSLSNQRFIEVAGFECEAPEAIVLHLVGKTGSRKVRVARTVAQRLTCETCGKKSKSSKKFCERCGTSLEKFGE